MRKPPVRLAIFSFEPSYGALEYNMRIVSACSTCRSRKKRCISRPRANVCQLCEAKSLQCDIVNVRIHTGLRSHPPNHSTPTIGLQSPESLVSTPATSLTPGIVAVTLQNKDLCNELVDIYFELIHEKQHIIFHRPSFLAEHRDGMAQDYLLLGIIALVARFSSNSLFENTSPWFRGLPFLQQAIKAYNTRPLLVCIGALQGAVLLAFASAVEGDSDQEALLLCQAIRMVQLMGLPQKLSTDSLRRQLEIRLYWQCWMTDCWNSVRCQVPFQLQDNPSFPRPVEEVFFDTLREGRLAGVHEDTEASRAPSIWAAILPLTRYHAQVVQLNYDLVDEPQMGFRIRHTVQELSLKLDRWRQNLPDHMQDTTANLTNYEARGHGQMFAVMHIIYHHTSQSLYYQFLNCWALDSDESVDEEAVTYAGRCKAHAVALSQLMWTLHTGLKRECLWSPVNGHLLVIASSIHLHTLLLDPCKTQVETARELLEQNFVMLNGLQKYFRYAESSFSRLRAFHRACERKGTPETFDMDSWMVKFLNRYDLAVGDRDVIPGEDEDQEFEIGEGQQIEEVVRNRESGLHFI